MVTSTDIALQLNSFSRVWLLPFTAGPRVNRSYEGLARAGAAEWSRGDITPIQIPDPDRYGHFIVAGKIQGERGLPTLAVAFRYKSDSAGIISRIVRNSCDHDIQVHMGVCQNPQDFNLGWDKILVLQEARPTNWSTPELGAFGPGDEAIVDENVDFTGEDLYEILRIIFDQQAASLIVQEIVDVVICDAVSCGACGITSCGCDIVFALTLTAGGSPGLPAEVIFTDDGGETYGETNVTTLAANQDPDAFACVGSNLVVISEDSESLHHAPIGDILQGVETWIEVTTGFVVGNGPLAIHAESQCHVWIVGENGYIYFSDDPTAGVIVQDAGVVTTQNLLDVHAFDIQNVIAVGISNALVLTRNGGATWAAVTGPNPGVDLNAVWMAAPDLWWVGDAGGQLWYTVDAGVNWVEKTFPGSGTGVIRDIQFSNRTVGYMAHDTTAPAGRILRTIDGGNSWYVAPESNAAIPANDRINALAPCESDVNVIYAGGLGDDATDGILVKGA